VLASRSLGGGSRRRGGAPTRPGGPRVVGAGVDSDPGGTPIIISRADYTSGTVRVWRLADGAPVGEPLTSHTGRVTVVAGGMLPDGIPVIISGHMDGTVQVWRTADSTAVTPPLHLPDAVEAVAFHGNDIITAAGTDIAVHQSALQRPMR
jgi:WD40 repeat protein